jgi:glycerophosphoryl diester phosphodiesterase
MSAHMAKPARTTIAAHRGGAALNPENSFAAFRNALALNADQIETDVHLSLDDVPIIMHDPTLDRTTAGIGAVRSFTAKELACVPLHGVDERVARLDDLLSLLAASQAGLRLEIKLDRKRAHYPSIVPIVLATLDAHRMRNRTTISSFDWETLRAINEHDATIPTLGLVKRERFVALGGLSAVVAEAFAFELNEIAIHDEQFGAEMMPIVEAQAIRLGLYAVNTERSIRRALDARVSAFTTDRPDLALAIRAEILNRTSAVV